MSGPARRPAPCPSQFNDQPLTSFRSPNFHDPSARVLLLALLDGCGDAAKTAVSTRPPVAVLVAPVQHADVPYTIEANGVVTPMASVAITSQVDGIVQQVGFREGQEVSRGQELFTMGARAACSCCRATRCAPAGRHRSS